MAVGVNKEGTALPERLSAKICSVYERWIKAWDGSTLHRQEINCSEAFAYSLQQPVWCGWRK